MAAQDPTVDKEALAKAEQELEDYVMSLPPERQVYAAFVEAKLNTLDTPMERLQFLFTEISQQNVRLQAKWNEIKAHADEAVAATSTLAAIAKAQQT